MTVSVSATNSPSPARPGQPASDPWSELLHEAQAGNRAALDLLLNELVPWLFILVRAAGVNEADAWDVVQESVLRLCQGIARFNPSRGGVRNWVARIARNLAIDLWRRQTRRRVVPLSAVELGSDRYDPALLAEREEDRTVLRHAVNDLKPEERAVVSLRYDDDLSYEELSKKLQIPIGTAGTRVHRAITSLRGRLRQTG
jgi:RNA polymerase sigma-70 factor (ECF subfamily)